MKKLLRRLSELSIDHPKKVLVITFVLTMLAMSAFPFMKIDTDPENMLEADHPDRVFYQETKKKFRIYDGLMVAVLHPTDVLQPDSLAAIDRATKRILELEGIVPRDVTSLTTSYNLIRLEDGTVSIPPIISGYSRGVSTGELPKTQEDVEELRKHINDNPVLREQLLTKDGRGTVIGIPLTSKDLSFDVKENIEKIFAGELLPEHQYHIAGIPVAEDQFGTEMFIQMGIVAPAAFMFIMLLVYLLFRQKSFLVPMGIDAMCSTIWAMGVLIASGNTIHIMSSMIPIFIMPVALLDDMHILSSFFDRFKVLGDKRRALLEALDDNHMPMLMTSLTSFFGYGALLLTHIPPVRVFGFFVALGMVFGFLLSITVVPACISLMSDAKLASIHFKDERTPSRFDKVLVPWGRFAFTNGRIIFGIAIVVGGLAVAGIMRTVVNDNPVNWFTEDHDIRVADRIANTVYAGSYPAYIVATSAIPEYAHEPEIGRYIDGLEAHMREHPVVGKAISPYDLVKLSHLRMQNNDPKYNVVNDTKAGIAQMLFMYESAADPLDLDMLLSRDRSSSILCIVMNKGDNQDMQAVEDHAAKYFAAHPPPKNVEIRWTGLPYINKSWQALMVTGMQDADVFSYGACMLLLVIVFRSFTLGVLGSIPLILSVAFCYGVVGWSGKEYDMPIAVCSSLAVGEGIDFAIHYLERWKRQMASGSGIEDANIYMFGDPGRAILRNVIVIAIGFLPLLTSTLSPYITVGYFFAGLMGSAGVVTFFLLPPMLRVLGRRYMKATPDTGLQMSA